MNEDRHTIVYASDNRGILPLGVSIHSLLKQASDTTRYRIQVLSNGITAPSRERLKQLVGRLGSGHELQFVDVPESLLEGRKSTAAWPVAAWARVFIPDLLPETRGVVLYLDIDTLVCDDLQALLKTPLHGKAIGAVLEHRSHAGSHFNDRLDMAPDSPGYFNSGVLLMDLDRFREQDLVNRVLAFAESHHEQLVCPDQDALNGALHDNVQPLHHRWNWHDGRTRLMLTRFNRQRIYRGASFETMVSAALSPGILHYQGKHKPWHYNYRIEGKRYLNAMKDAGFYEGSLPGFSWQKWLKRVAYQPIYWMTWLKLSSMQQTQTKQDDRKSEKRMNR